MLKLGKNLQRLLQLVVVGAAPPCSQLPPDGDDFLDPGQRLLPPAQIAEPGRQGVQRRGQVGLEHVRTDLGQLPLGFDGFLARGERVLPPS